MIKRLLYILILSGAFTTSCAHAQDSLLTVESAVKLAIENNYGVKIARTKQEIAELNNSWGFTNLVPAFYLNGGYTYASPNLLQKLNTGAETKKNGTIQKSTTGGLSMSWTIFDGMRMFATKSRLEELEHIGEINFHGMIDTTVYNVTTAYFNIVRLKQEYKATQEQIILSQERLKIADTRFRVGAAPKNDMLQATVDLNQQKSTLISLENSIAVSKVNLNTLLARKTDPNFEVVDTFNVSDVPALDDLQNKADAQNPNVLVGMSNVSVYMQIRRENLSSYLPSVDLSGGYNYSRSSNSAGLTLYNQTYGPSAGVTVSIPLFTGVSPKRIARIGDAQIKVQQLNLEQLRINVSNTIRTNYLNYQNSMKLIALERQNLQAAKENTDIALERFRRLNMTSVEFRQIQISYSDAQNRLYDAQYNAKLAQLQLSLLSGEMTK